MNRIRSWFHNLKGRSEKKHIGRLPAAARAYILSLGGIGLAVVFSSLIEAQPDNVGQFLFYLIASVLSSNLKVWLPGLTGTLSVNYVFILIAGIELNLAQTVTIGCFSGVSQLFWSAKKRPRGVQVWFTFSSMAVCSALAFGVLHAKVLQPVLGGLAFRLFWACVAYFLANTFTVGGVVALTEGRRFWALWKDDLCWTAPHYLAGATAAAVVHISNQYLGWQSAVLVLPVIYLLYHSYRIYISRLSEEKRHVSEMADLHLRTIEALALAVDAKDGTTHDHLRRVQVYAREIGRELGLPDDERRALEAASLLHDIGKLAVPEHIISKPGRLSPVEFDKMKIHPIVGAEILESVRFPYPVVPIVRAHHEKWNGTGYPDGLKGEEIPIGARILAAVDCLDALASDRQYRRALTLNEALEKIAEESGRSFDPRVVDVLKRRCHELERMATGSITNGQTARLSTSIHVSRGSAPDAGFTKSSATSSASRADFLGAIAAARQEFQTLLELTNDLGNSLRIDDTMALLASRLKDAVPYTGIAIYTIKGGHLATQYAAGDEAALFASLQIPLGEGLSGWVAGSNRPILNGNPSVEPGYLNDPETFSTLRSALSVPLPGTSGVIGALSLYHREADAFTNDHLRILMAISSKAGLTIENALRFVQAEKTAVTDALTGLPNARSLFLHMDSEVARASRTRSRLAVVVLDMDGFKQVNDQFGHTTGNQVLQATARALRSVCREYDYAARMGGDEFVLVMPDIDEKTVNARLEQIEGLVKEIGRHTGNVDFLGVSAGAAYYDADATCAEQLLAIADARMYENKHLHHTEAAARELATLAQATATDNVVKIRSIRG